VVGVGSAGDVTISPFVWCYQAEYAVRTSHESLGGDRQEIPAGFQSALPPKRSSAGWFTRAVKAAKVQAITPHDLRHTCASLAVSAGANVLALARMLGHKDPSVTLRVYADLFDDDLDAVAVTLHTRYSRSSVGKVWARAASDDLSQSSENASITADSPEILNSGECGRRDLNPHALPSTGT
jgi:Phage integrase family